MRTTATSGEILMKLEQRVDRRGFLRGSGLAAAALVGAAAFPHIAGAQGPAPQEKPADKPAEGKGDGKPTEKPAEAPKTEEVDPFKVTKIDEKGKPYRMCPQCGSNMYQQDKTWTCETCGYSYVE